MDFVFNNLCVSVDGIQILHNVSGSLSPGELLAVMGPSGAGKTTLMNTLNGRLPYTGTVMVGGSPLSKSMKRRLCYVLQQDFFFGNLTLQETLQFTAMIRLPDKMSKEEKMARMKSVVEALDLSGCLNTIMGDMFTPGLSGGQKKRASIASELLRDPDAIFLDEPTTGLDSSTASDLVSLLKNYAVSSKKTVIASIHQPSSQIFFQFDKLLLLTQGQVAYCGPTDEVVDYFHCAGLDIEEGYNPADFILEALSESEEFRKKLLSAASYKRENSMAVDLEKVGASSDSSVVVQRTIPKTPPSDNMLDSFADMDSGSVRMSLLDLYDTNNDLDPDVEEPGKWPSGFWTQYSQLMIRTFQQSRRRVLCKGTVLQNFLICLVVCLIFFRLPRTEETLRDRMGAVFFIAAHWGFTPLFDAVTSFPMERMVINKERAAGWYRLSAYYLAKMTSELALALIMPTGFVVLAYWMIGLNGIEAFFATLGTVFIDSIAGQSFGLFVGIACLQINQAMTVSITFQMAIMLLGGLFTRNIPVWLDWMKYMSFLHYVFHSLMALEFSGNNPVQCLAERNNSAFKICQEPNVSSIPPEKVLEYYDVQWTYWEYISPLLVFIIGFRLLGYFTLRYLRKPF